MHGHSLSSVGLMGLQYEAAPERAALVTPFSHPCHSRLLKATLNYYLRSENGVYLYKATFYVAAASTHRYLL